MARYSIVTAMYNHRPFLGERVESILAQTERDWEWIIVDDASTDGSFEELLRLTEGEPRVRVLRNEHNAGFTFTTQRGIDLATGEFLYRADSDDSSHPLFLEALGSVLTRNPALALVVSRALNLDSSGKAWGGWPRRKAYTESGLAALARFVMGNTACAPAILYRRATVQAAGGFATLPDLRVNSDWNLTMGCLLHGDFSYVDWPLSYYRQHESGISGVSSRTPDAERLEIEMYSPLIRIYQELGSRSGPAFFPSFDVACEAASQLIFDVCVTKRGFSAEDAEAAPIVAMIQRHSPGFHFVSAPKRRFKQQVRQVGRSLLKIAGGMRVERHRAKRLRGVLHEAGI